MGAHHFDEHYAQADRVWSGRPNAALVTEVTGMAPRAVLDVGSGEGADAIWLAAQGWQVTGLEPSGLAMDRARAAAATAGVEVTWLQAELAGAPLPRATYDLVSACYPALARTASRTNERSLLDAVAPGGTLLWVHHADIDRARALEHGHDPDHYLAAEDVLATLDDTWTVQTHERRERDISGGAGAHHHVDVVLRLRRS